MQNGETGAGKSLHITRHYEENVTLRFYGELRCYSFKNMPKINYHSGSNIHLYGQTNCSYDVILDNTSYTNLRAQGELLYSKMNLPTGTHMMNLIVRPNGTQQFGFDYAVISTPIDRE